MKLTSLTLALALTTTGTAYADGLQRPVLPPPSGPAQVGTASLRLVDPARHDPWKPEKPYRELMVSVFYPARDAERYPVAPHMLPGAAKAYDEFAGPGNAGVPTGLVDWAATKTHSHVGAPVDLRGGPRPVVLYGAGAGDPRTWNTTAVEDLASRGYLVVTVDHTYEAAGVEFPGGRVERTVLPELIPPEGPPPASLLRNTLTRRVGDLRSVLDRLPEIGVRVPGLLGAMDLGEIGVFGHSGGGFAALQTMHDDPRVKAAVNMDGLLSHTPEDTGDELSSVAADGVDRPFLLLGHERGGHHARPSWNALWQHSTGWRGDLLLRDSKHASFTDAEAIEPQLHGLPEPASERIGTVDPAAALAANHAYVASFFDRFLRGVDDHLLDAPSPAHPDIDFVS
ncbi:hypothetical protein [Amycolatopsis minnesotensis]|uniref:Lipase n=1 Tax=Amycolatopsis minnesotensis TaxID=337894 RepID=A0ABN2SCQ0_9PSEU